MSETTRVEPPTDGTGWVSEIAYRRAEAEAEALREESQYQYERAEKAEAEVKALQLRVKELEETLLGIHRKWKETQR